MKYLYLTIYPDFSWVKKRWTKFPTHVFTQFTSLASRTLIHTSVRKGRVYLKGSHSWIRINLPTDPVDKRRAILRFLLLVNEKIERITDLKLTRLASIVDLVIALKVEYHLIVARQGLRIIMLCQPLQGFNSLGNGNCCYSWQGDYKVGMPINIIG